MKISNKELKPKKIVKYLDTFIIGQKDAKKAVAIALRNRLRRLLVENEQLKNEIHPKNIIMIGPTGVGKTEIARRIAKLVQAPFIKVEATKYTEVGYVGRDVESMIRDLAAIAFTMVHKEHVAKLEDQAIRYVNERIIDILVKGHDDVEHSNMEDTSEEDKKIRNIFKHKLEKNQLDDKEIEINMATQNSTFIQMSSMPGMEDMENQMNNLLSTFLPKNKTTKKVKVKIAQQFLLAEEIEKLIDMEHVKTETIHRTQEQGIIFIDEIDKIASRISQNSMDVSREGVQRDILPLIEGSTVTTKYGQVDTAHILFIAAGAFHISSVTDLIPELQGRFPIRVELQSLSKEDYVAILKSPMNSLSKQYQALLLTDNISIKFEDSSYEHIADIAHTMNTKNENIGARRLYTIMEKLFEDMLYDPEKYHTKVIVIDVNFVKKQLSNILQDQNLARYIL